MADQGWMVDDGTCDPCLRGNCYICDDPITWYGDDGPRLSCCCNESVDLGYVEEEE